MSDNQILILIKKYLNNKVLTLILILTKNHLNNNSQIIELNHISSIKYLIVKNLLNNNY